MTTIEEKWKRRTTSAGPEYELGVQNPTKDWQAATVAAEASYNAGVQAAITAKRYGKGVTLAGTKKWQDGAINKGVRRFGEGVALSQQEYAKGFSPFREVIARITLPPRGPKGDPNNINRVAIIAKALHDAKTAQTKG